MNELIEEHLCVVEGTQIERQVAIMNAANDRHWKIAECGSKLLNCFAAAARIGSGTQSQAHARQQIDWERATADLATALSQGDVRITRQALRERGQYLMCDLLDRFDRAGEPTQRG
jgi:hypothetical protein